MNQTIIYVFEHVFPVNSAQEKSYSDNKKTQLVDTVFHELQHLKGDNSGQGGAHTAQLKADVKREAKNFRNNCSGW